MLLCIYEGDALVHSSADLSMATDTEGLIHVILYGLIKLRPSSAC
jgi:hypothetical protein